MAKSRPRRRIRRVPKTRHKSSGKILSKLDRINELVQDAHYEEALKLVQPLAEKFPNNSEVILHLAIAQHGTHDLLSYLQSCERLCQLEPDNPEMALPLISAYQVIGRPVLALQNYRRFLERWPDHEEIKEIREKAKKLEDSVPALIQTAGFVGEEGIELAALHERSQILMERGKYAEASATANELLERMPDFVPAMNNLSQIYFSDGNREQAIALAQQVLEKMPENVQALSNISRYLLLSGRVEEARQYLERLRVVKIEILDNAIKKAEAFSYFGDDEAVLEAAKEAEEAGWLTEDEDAFFLCHWAGVAAARLGQTEKARSYFRQSLEHNPGYSIAQQNLRDLNKPEGERNGPWAFDLTQWMSRHTAEDLIRVSKMASQEKDDPAALTERLRQYLQKHPELNTILSMMLERGGADSRQFATFITSIAKTPELLAALRDFALGQSGTDQQRLNAIGECSQAGVIEGGEIRVWIKGKQDTLLTFGFEVHGDVVHRHPKNVERLVEKGINATYLRDGVTAEKYFRQAVELAPDSPEILNNLAAALSLQRRDKESLALIEEIHLKHPDYLFARTNLAMHSILQGDLDRAGELIDPLLKRKKIHYLELAAICGVQIELALARKERKSAESWLNLWEQADPENPKLERFRQRVKPAKSPDLLNPMKRR